METEIKSYLCKSVLVQKELPKLLASRQGERSQDGAAMDRRVEARQPYSGGCRVGLPVARVSALCTKREFPAFVELLGRIMRLSFPAFAGKWRCHLEKMAHELDRRSPTLSPVVIGETSIDKAPSETTDPCNGGEKSSLLASSSGITADPEYLPLGGKGETLESKQEFLASMKPVSPSPEATKWPIRTSSRITTRTAKKQLPIGLEVSPYGC